ncbi:uncharacterized protein LOC131012445 [Salvia miltiorrhiza]|uniref:uncharacterized protein LOC131012445 n=1 Tax=Salvia miltiorrhiza TaxID=226208 RepID=UPI0025AC3A6F|nr:uncharacterized protein LOC131012445 [Salvia miltiorrhiza]
MVGNPIMGFALAWYLGKLEEALKKNFPGTNIKGMPHIHSKISTWKKNYNSLTYMLDKTGFGFNIDGKHMIDCDDELWAEICQLDQNARSMRKKSWPFLEDWKEIFGKDRAAGKEAEDVMDAVNDMHRPNNVDSAGVHGDYYVPIEGEAETAGADESVYQSEKDKSVARTINKKRKANDVFDGLVDVLGEMSRNADVRADSIVSRIGYKFDLGKARKEVYAQLNCMTTLDMNEKFEAYEILAGEKQGLELFMGLPDDAKPHYVAYILSTKKH